MSASAAPPAAAAPGPFQAAWNGVKGTPGYNSKYKNAGLMNTGTKKWNEYLAGLKAKAVPPPPPAGGVDPKVVAAAAAALATAKAAKPTTKVEAEAAATTASEAADTVKGDPLEAQLKAEATRIRALIASGPLTGGRRRKSRKSRKATKKAKKSTRKTKKSKRSRKSKGRK